MKRVKINQNNKNNNKNMLWQTKMQLSIIVAIQE